jgi:uncharacterized protein (TIGR00251 family)
MTSKITVKLHPNSSQEKIKKLDGAGSDGTYEVWLKEKPIEGKANKQLIKILKKHFKKNIKIIKGAKSRSKVIEITEAD